jgi:outer membrane murein-binding lipoprotein Lpp
MNRIGVKRVVAGSLVALFVAAGCASTGDMDSVRNEASEARRIAEEANAKASAASADAAAARAAAEAAAADAREANEKADRIFQRSLHK